MGHKFCKFGRGEYMVMSSRREKDVSAAKKKQLKSKEKGDINYLTKGYINTRT